jgi:hypothetical protein
MDKNERVVSFFDLRFFSKVHGDDTQIAALTIGDALLIAHEMWSKDALSLGNKTIQITLDDWVYLPRAGEHHLIINRADASMLDIPLKDTKTRKRRMAGKTPDEGIDLSAHLLIKLSAKPDHPASLLVTGGSSLQSADVGRYLGRLFRQAKAMGKYEKLFRREHPSGEHGKTINMTSHFALEAHPSANIKDILRKGQLEGLELIALSDSKFDAEKTFSIAHKALKLELVEPGKPMLLKTFTDAIKSAAQSLGGDEPDLARLTYRPDGEKQIFVKKERIKFSSPILPMYEKIQPVVVDKLRQLL